MRPELDLIKEKRNVWTIVARCASVNFKQLFVLKNINFWLYILVAVFLAHSNRTRWLETERRNPSRDSNFEEAETWRGSTNQKWSAETDWGARWNKSVFCFIALKRPLRICMQRARRSDVHSLKRPSCEIEKTPGVDSTTPGTARLNNLGYCDRHYLLRTLIYFTRMRASKFHRNVTCL